MIKTASLENSKRLYELTGWKPGLAYDLEWLLDKLPNMVIENDDGYLVPTSETKGTCLSLTHIENGNWFAEYQGYYMEEDVTPSDAACLLLIKLIEQNIIKVGE
jgi:hypothetical protein